MPGTTQATHCRTASIKLDIEEQKQSISTVYVCTAAAGGSGKDIGDISIVFRRERRRGYAGEER